MSAKHAQKSDNQWMQDARDLLEGYRSLIYSDYEGSRGLLCGYAAVVEKIDAVLAKLEAAHAERR